MFCVECRRCSHSGEQVVACYPVVPLDLAPPFPELLLPDTSLPRVKMSDGFSDSRGARFCLRYIPSAKRSKIDGGASIPVCSPLLALVETRDMMCDKAGIGRR